MPSGGVGGHGSPRFARDDGGSRAMTEGRDRPQVICDDSQRGHHCGGTLDDEIVEVARVSIEVAT